VADAVGHTLGLGYDARNRLHTVTGPEGVGSMTTTAPAICRGQSTQFYRSIGATSHSLPTERGAYSGTPATQAPASKQQDLANRVSRIIDDALDDSLRQKTYQTNTRYNPITGQCYSGRTSGYNDPLTNVRNRVIAYL